VFTGCINVPKLTCPKCGSDVFHVHVYEKDEVFDDAMAIHRVRIITVITVSCSSCDWNKKFAGQFKEGKS